MKLIPLHFNSRAQLLGHGDLDVSLGAVDGHALVAATASLSLR